MLALFAFKQFFLTQLIIFVSSIFKTVMTSYLIRNSVSFIKLSNPPVNGLSLAVRDGIMKGLDQARADKTRGVVFFGDGKNFCAGGDITEFAKHQHAASPSLNEVRVLRFVLLSQITLPF
jgi:enoyl-CoA hydratase/carnithine racemase